MNLFTVTETSPLNVKQKAWIWSPVAIFFVFFFRSTEQDSQTLHFPAKTKETQNVTSNFLEVA